MLSLPLLVTVLSWGFNFVSVKIIYREISPEAVSLSRFLVMWAVLLLCCFARKESVRPLPEDRWPVLLVGFVTMGVYMVLFLLGMHSTSPSEGAIVLATVPLLTPIIAVLMKQESFSSSAFLGAGIAFAGVICVALGGGNSGHGSLVGDSILFVSAFVWAYGIVLTRPLVKKYSPLQVMTMSMPGALPVLVPFGFLALIRTPWTHLQPLTWLMLAQVALLSGVIGFVFFNIGIKKLGASGASLYQFFVPAIASFFAFLVLQQTLSLAQWFGFAVVLAGVAYGLLARHRANLKLVTQVSGV